MRLAKLPKANLFLAAVALVLLLVPTINQSSSTLFFLSQIFIFAVFAMSYDLLLGYTGIVSFGHAMFFGLGAYSIGLCIKNFGATGASVLIAVVITIVATALLSYIVGFLTLRLKSHFFAMFTLAVAGILAIIAEKWRTLTSGRDGFTFAIPDFLQHQVSFYFIALGLMIVTYIVLRRFTFSPVGKVLQAIRENETRAESLGYHVIHYKLIANVVAGVIAGLSGILYAVSLRFVSTSVFAVDVTLDALLMTIIGGVGTLIGAIVGASLIEIAQHFLMQLSDVHWIFERWIIPFGTLFILAVMFFPKGIVGTSNTWWVKWKYKRRTNQESEPGTTNSESSKAIGE